MPDPFMHVLVFIQRTAGQPAELRISFCHIINRTPSLQYASTDPRISGAICKVYGLFSDKRIMSAGNAKIPNEDQCLHMKCRLWDRCRKWGL